MMIKIDKRKNFAVKLLMLLHLTLSFSVAFSSLIISAEEGASREISEEGISYTVSYGKGIYISYAGSEPKNFIKGDPPADQTVSEGEEVIVASNTFTFRDYSFGGWKYTYTDSNGDKQTKYFVEGDVIESLDCDMKLEATWTKLDSDLKISAYATYADTNEKSEHYIGEITVLKNAPLSPSEDHEFCGWTDNEGTVLYSPGDSYEIKNINTVIKPVWSVNGEQINYRKISVTATKGGSASVSQIYILAGASQGISFTPDEGYTLDSVTVNGVSKGAMQSITVTVQDEDIYINAIFSEIPKTEESSDDASSSDQTDEFTVTVFIEGGGSVSPSSCFTVKSGESATVTFIPDENYRLPFEINHNGTDEFLGKDWNGEYTLTAISEDHVLNIFFISETSVLNPTIENESKDNTDTNTNSKFTAKICVFILILAAVFGFLAVKFSRVDPKKKKIKKQMTERRKGI